jgi:hypothetical protein
MNNKLVEKLYWITWCIITILTGILAGFLISHSIMLGRFFTLLIESGKETILHQTYTVFREAANPHIPYNMFFILALAAGILWTVFAFIVRKTRVIACIAGMSTFWVSCTFFATNFGRAEVEVMTAVADAKMTHLYITWNVPIHTAFAIFYTLSLILLLWVPLKDKLTGKQSS